MAITDLQQGQELQTGANSITYQPGDIQRSDPQIEQQKNIAQQIWDQLDWNQKSQFGTFEQFYQSGAWKEIFAQMQQQQEAQPQQQMMARGGITRQSYGLGDLVRKLIPNEIAQVAEVAAPFVAPFNPLAAGLMGGLGSYDRTGNLMGGVKRGLLTYGGGQLARGLGGGLGNLQKGFDPRTGMQGMGSGLKKYFSSPVQKSGGLGRWLDRRAQKAAENEWYKSFSGDKNLSEFDVIEGAKKKALKQSDTKGLLDIVKSKTGLAILGSMGAAYGLTAKDYKPDEVVDIMVDRGKGMEVDAIRKEVQEALAAGEEAWNALREKYPYLGEYPTKGRAEGGRIGYEGGGSADPILMEEYKKYVFEMEEMGLTPMSFEQFIAQARAGQAQGGRTGYKKGGSRKGYGDYVQAMNALGLDPMPIGIYNSLSGIMTDQEMVNMGSPGKAKGGRIGAQEGGIMDLGGMEKDYRNEGGFVPIGEYEKKDDVPARLSKNEFVFTADAVRAAGGGDVDAGADKMYNTMKQLESRVG